VRPNCAQPRSSPGIGSVVVSVVRGQPPPNRSVEQPARAALLAAPMVASSRRLVWRGHCHYCCSRENNAVDKVRGFQQNRLRERLNRCCSTEPFLRIRPWCLLSPKVPGRVSSPTCSRSVVASTTRSRSGESSCSISMLLRLLSARCSRYPGVSRGSIMYASADFWRRKTKQVR